MKRDDLPECDVATTVQIMGLLRNSPSKRSARYEQTVFVYSDNSPFSADKRFDVFLP